SGDDSALYKMLAPSPDLALTDDKVNAALRALMGHQREMDRCYQQALKQDPSLVGTMMLHFNVSEDGRVELENNSLVPDEVTKCIRARAQSWRFPGIGPTQVAQKMIFTVQ